MPSIPQIKLPSGRTIPQYGLGTWGMGESARNRTAEVTALKLGFDLGVTLVDTAEMYGSGGAEEITGEAMAGRRDELYVVSKVLPENATRRGTIAACERSLKRMRTDRIELYLLHWRGSPPLDETLDALLSLQRDGKIIDWGVSNFDTDDMEELADLDGGDDCASNQVLYNLTRRGIEYDLLPWCNQRSIPVMAYSPIEQGRMLGHKTLATIAARHNATPAQVALAWLLAQKGVVSIPKATNHDHLRENLKSLDLKLTTDDFATLDQGFPPPKRKQPLGML